jgi:hypothetical protein
MIQNQNVSNLRFVLCPGRNPEARHLDLYNQIYDSWHSVWQATYKELEDTSPLYSDAFTRQDYIAAIFDGSKCLAFLLFRLVDTQSRASLKDSYFEQWSELHRHKFSQAGKNILICGNLGIVPEARQETLGISLKHLITGFMTKIALHSAADISICTPRIDRGVHSAVYRWGAYPIAQNVDWGLNVLVDLVAFDKQSILAKHDHELVPLVSKLWQERLVIRETPLESVDSFSSVSESPLPSKISEKKKAA